MTLRQVSLKDYRNYPSLELALNPNITILVGDNAQGKTNLVEAIYLLSTGRSHRVQDERLLIRHDQAFAVCKARFEESSPMDLKVVLHEKGKTLFYQNQPLKRSSEFIGKMNAVLFSPADMDLFEASPRARRRLLDIELGKINPQYMERLLHYAKVLKDRNALLKQAPVDEAYLEVLTEALIEHQLELIPLRRSFVANINEHLEKVYQELSIDTLSLRLNYKGPVQEGDALKEALSERYLKQRDRDYAFKQTHVGIHRDDLEFQLAGRNVLNLASQGQKRMVIIALKCALIEVIEAKTGRKPILLLDDVFSELDHKRKRALFELLHQNTQTIITTTDLDQLQLWMKDDVSVYEVSSGTVTPRRINHD
jgi:DNA replication and repair protein RecF